MYLTGGSVHYCFHRFSWQRRGDIWAGRESARWCVLCKMLLLVSDLGQGRRQSEPLRKTGKSCVKPNWRKRRQEGIIVRCAACEGVPELSIGCSSGKEDQRVKQTRREGTATHRVVNDRSARVGGLRGTSCGVLDARGEVQGLPWMPVDPHFLAW